MSTSQCSWIKLYEVKIKKAKLFLAWQLGWRDTDCSQPGGPFRWVALIELQNIATLQKIQEKKIETYVDIAMLLGH
jgi:hypothetical protein